MNGEKQCHQQQRYKTLKVGRCTYNNEK